MKVIEVSADQTRSICVFTTYPQQILHVQYFVHFLSSNGLWMNGGHRGGIRDKRLQDSIN